MVNKNEPLAFGAWPPATHQPDKPLSPWRAYWASHPEMLGIILGVLFMTLLGAALVSVVLTAFEKARELPCRATQIQLSLGLMMYAQDYDEHFPLPGRWQTATLPYVRNYRGGVSMPQHTGDPFIVCAECRFSAGGPPYTAFPELAGAGLRDG